MRRRLAVLGILSMLLAPVVPSPAAAAPAAVVRAAPVAAVPARVAVEDTGKYYVVGPPVNGQQEYLFNIAAKTLKDGGRAEEIFALNEGRLQPDGETMTDPTSLKPGWILVLPKDASGTGVRTGTPPAAGGAPPATTAPEQTAAAEDEKTETPPDSARPPDDNADTLSFLQSPLALRIALIVLAVLLLVWAQLALSSRRRTARTRPATAGGGIPAAPVPSSSGSTRTQVITAVALPDAQQRREGKNARKAAASAPPAPPAAPPVPAPQHNPWAAPQPDPWPAPQPDPWPAAAQPGPWGSPQESSPTVPQLTPLPPPPPVPSQQVFQQPPAPVSPAPTFAPAVPDTPPPAKPAPAKPAPAKPAPAKPAPAKPAPEPVFENYDSPAERSFLSAIALPRPGAGLAELMPQAPPNPFAALVTDLICGDVPAQARLIGARPARWGAAHGWLADGEKPPPSGVPVVLGTHQGRRLWVDLTVAPDVLALGGDPDACRDQGRDLARQLAGTVDVAIVGDVLGGLVPDGCRGIGSVADLSADRPAATTRVVICDAAEAAALYARLRAIPAGRGRTVPVVIGEGPAARWSVHLGNAVPSESGQATVQSTAS